MSTVERRFINEGVLRIALFFIIASLTYTVRNYTWAVVLIVVVALYSLITGIIMMNRSQSEETSLSGKQESRK